jgi:hypothetical protein
MSTQVYRSVVFEFLKKFPDFFLCGKISPAARQSGQRRTTLAEAGIALDVVDG